MNSESFKEQFIIEYFKQVREELTARVQIHANLVLQKIARNINNLHRLGTFIRKELEPLVPKINLWEQNHGQNPNKSKNHGNAEINFLSLFTLSTEVISAVIYLNVKPVYLIFVLILLMLHIFVVIFMRRQILSFEK
jgi:preprotein translocase subunit SecE